MRDKEIKVTLQRRPEFQDGGNTFPEVYFVKRIVNSLFVKTEIGTDGRRRGSLKDPELKYFVGDKLTPRQAEDIATCYESTVIAESNE